VAGPILGIDFLRKFRITVAPETSQVLFACTVTVTAATEPPLPSVSPIVEPFVSIPSTQKIPDSVHNDVDRLLKKLLSILRTGDMMPTPTHGVSITFTRAVTTQYCKIQSPGSEKNFKLQKRNSNVWNLPALFAVQNPHGLPFAQMVPKKYGSWQPCGNYRRLNLVRTLDMYP
jgi:hypothetical protein